MTNEDKMLRYMLAKPLLTKTIMKILNDCETISKKVRLEKPELVLVFAMDFLRTAVVTSLDCGLEVDLDGFCETMKREVADAKKGAED